MTPLAAAADAYLRMRRALGFKLYHLTWWLPDFVAFVESHGSPTITAALAVRWARGMRHPGRVIEAFVDFTDSAPTILDYAATASKESGSPAATRSCSLTMSIPVTISVTGCSTWRRVFISRKKNSPSW